MRLPGLHGLSPNDECRTISLPPHICVAKMLRNRWGIQVCPQNKNRPKTFAPPPPALQTPPQVQGAQNYTETHPCPEIRQSCRSAPKAECEAPSLGPGADSRGLGLFAPAVVWGVRMARSWQPNAALAVATETRGPGFAVWTRRLRAEAASEGGARAAGVGGPASPY